MIYKGTVIVQPLAANLTRDTDTMSKMDPYCKVIFGDKKKQTKPHTGAGKTPQWRDD